ncbi:MAG: hypothetical protein H6843_08850 [Rhodospirillaceae bacterium]|nr:hypothetical protein [Rhodospirillaceae bacterium]
MEDIWRAWTGIFIHPAGNEIAGLFITMMAFVLSFRFVPEVTRSIPLFNRPGGLITLLFGATNIAAIAGLSWWMWLFVHSLQGR